MVRCSKIWCLITELLVVALLVACTRDRMDDRGKGISLAISLKNVGEVPEVQTKMTATITQDGAGFRGIEQVYIIPFQTASANPVTVGSGRLGDSNVQIQNPAIGQNGLVENNCSHLYNMVSVPLQTNRVLAYGKAIDSGNTYSKNGKHKNGVLNASGLDNPNTPSDISFSLEPVLETDDLTEINTISDNLIAALNGVVEVLQASEDEDIRVFLDAFTVENEITACSYQNLYNMEQSIFGALSYYSGTNPDAISEVMGKLSELQAARGLAGSTFPASYGIPEGSIGMWWNGHRFVKIHDNVNISLVPMTGYCYPPSLWYYANSKVQTSNDDSVTQQYKPQNTTWGSILTFYDGGGAVTTATRSVAIVDQMQYGVGLVEFRFRSLGSNAEVARGCPLTGIIIGDQKNVDYSFAPNSSDSYFVYDNTISGITLGSTSQYVQMLVLPTTGEETVHFALEFQNNASSTFRCQQGTVPPGCKFYLAGELKPGNGTKPEGNEEIADVFNSDHKTTVYIKVKSLDYAYNTVPDLRDPQLELGVVAEMDWVQLDPGGLKLPF